MGSQGNRADRPSFRRPCATRQEATASRVNQRAAIFRACYTAEPLESRTLLSLSTVVDPTATGFSTSISLTPGAQTYIYGEVTGGGFSTSPLANGSGETVTNGLGNLVAGLAVTTQSTNSFTTQASYYSIAGVGVSSYTSMQALYAQYINPNSGDISSGSFGTSVNFTLTQSALVVAVGLGGSQQAISFQGPAGLVTDAAVSGSGDGLPNTAGIAHDYLSPGTYTIQLTTTVTSDLQLQQAMADLLGVYIFTDSATTVVPSAALATPSGTQSGDVTIPYTLNDANSDTCSILPEYSTDGGMTWNGIAYAAGGGASAFNDLASSPGGTKHTFVWESNYDLPNVESSDVEFRIVPSSDAGTGTSATTGIFTIDNRFSAIITSPTIGTLSGNVTVSYLLTDPTSNICNITAEYSINGGSSWLPAAYGGGDGTTGLTSSPSGEPHQFVWVTDADLFNAQSKTVEFQITPNSANGMGTPSVPASFVVDNPPSETLPGGLTPALIKYYYGFDLLPYNGAGQTIAIVDAGYDKSIFSDLQTFSSQFGLPAMNEVIGAPTSAGNSGSLPTFYWDTLTTAAPTQNDTYYETALDVEWAHAIAPMANIVLVEAQPLGSTDILAPVLLIAAEAAATLPGVSVVSMSWGGSVLLSADFDTSLAADELLKHVTFVAAAGDQTLTPQYPATSPYVLSVGGTSLSNTSGQWAELPEDYGLGPDVSYAAQLDNGPYPQFDVYETDSSGISDWSTQNGTSAGAPQWAALIALANQGREANGVANLVGFTQALPAIGAAPGGDFNPNTSSFDTGRGSPVANLLVPYLASWKAPELIFTQQPTNIAAGNAFSVTVAIEDQNGNILTSDNSNVTIALGPDPTLYGTTTVAAIKGVATFNNLYVDTSGDFSFVATDASDGLTSSTPSIPITIAPAAAVKLAFVQQPTNSAAGSTISPAVTVAIEDKYGNVVTSNDSYVTLCIGNSHGAPVGPDLSGLFDPSALCGPFGPRLDKTETVQAQNGVATFKNLSEERAGTYAFLATDRFLTQSISDSFTISAGPAKRMVFVGTPSRVSPDKPPSEQVELLDQYGNVATNDASDVTLSLSAHPKRAALTGSLTAPVVNGIATFNGLSFSVAGFYSLLAVDNNDILSVVSPLFYAA